MKKQIWFPVISLTLVALFCISAGMVSESQGNQGPVNAALAKQGSTLYTSKCAMCHGLDQKTVGPVLRNVTKKRTPQFIMDLLLNPAKMQKENAEVKKLMKEYNNLPMVIPGGITQPEAKAVIEYLRSVATK